MSNLSRNIYDIVDTDTYDIDSKGTGNSYSETFLGDKKAVRYRLSGNRIESVIRPTVLSAGNKYEVYYEFSIPETHPDNFCVIFQFLQATDSNGVSNPSIQLHVNKQQLKLLIKDLAAGVRELVGAGTNQWEIQYIPGRRYRCMWRFDVSKSAGSGFLDFYVDGVLVYSESGDPIFVDVAQDPSLKMGLYTGDEDTSSERVIDVLDYYTSRYEDN